MKKTLKILLVSLGSLALLAGVAGTIYGTSDNVKNWIDSKINNETNELEFPTYSDSDFETEDQNQSGSGSEQQEQDPSPLGGGGSEQQEQDPSPSGGGGSEQQEPQGNFDNENCSIQVSTNKVYLIDTAYDEVDSDPINATIVGNPSDRRLVWYPVLSNYLTVNKAITNCNEDVIISSTEFFTGTQTVRVCMAANPSIYKDIPVYYVNSNTTIPAIRSMGVLNAAGDEFASQASSSTIGGNSAANYTDHAGTYFHCDRISRSTVSMCDSPENAMTTANLIQVVASQGAKLGIRFSIETGKKSSKPVLCGSKEVPTTYEAAIVPEYTTINVNNFRVGYVYTSVNAFWYVSYLFDLEDDFDGKSGYICFKFCDRYYAIHFNPYVPLTSNTITLDETTIDLGA